MNKITAQMVLMKVVIVEITLTNMEGNETKSRDFLKNYSRIVKLLEERPWMQHREQLLVKLFIVKA